jgi:hypothetical protein
VSAPAAPKTIREQLKAWCSRRLSEQEAESAVREGRRRGKWWADRGSIRWIFREADLEAAVDYVLNRQDAAVCGACSVTGPVTRGLADAAGY